MSSYDQARLRLLVDTNVLIDFTNMRTPFYESARLLMALGAVGELELWISSSQMTDLAYILSDGGKPKLVPEALERLRKLRSFIKVASVGADEIDDMLATSWTDPEDALMHQVALSLKADCIISRDAEGFQESMLPVMDCQGFFEWIKEEHNIVYAEIPL